MSVRRYEEESAYVFGSALSVVNDVDQYPVLALFYGYPEFTLGKVIEVSSPAGREVLVHAKLKRYVPPPEVTQKATSMALAGGFLVHPTLIENSYHDKRAYARLARPTTLYAIDRIVRPDRPVPEERLSELAGDARYYVAWAKDGDVWLLWALRAVGEATPRMSLRLSAPPRRHAVTVYGLSGDLRVLDDAPYERKDMFVHDINLTVSYNGRVKWQAKKLLFADVSSLNVIHPPTGTTLSLGPGRYLIYVDLF